MRDTSIKAYNEIKDSKLLSRRRLEVYEILFNHGPLTANEIVRQARLRYPNTNQTGFNARLSELKRLGVIIEVSKKPDKVSGKTCYVWDVTSNLPKKPKKFITTLSRSHLLKCREILLEVYRRRDLPFEIRTFIKDSFEVK